MENMPPEQYEETLIDRIAECETVMRDLEQSEAWKIVIRDLGRWLEQIDSHWHMADEKQIKELRINKFAISKIKNLALGYAEDLKSCSAELDKLQNPEDNIIKDFDNGSV